MAWATLGGRSAHWEAPPAPTTASKSRYGNDTSSRPPALSLDVVGTHTEHKLHLLADISSSPHDAFCRRRARRRTRRTGDAGAVARRPALDGPPTTVAAPASRGKRDNKGAGIWELWEVAITCCPPQTHSIPALAWSNRQPQVVFSTVDVSVAASRWSAQAAHSIVACTDSHHLVVIW